MPQEIQRQEQAFVMDREVQKLVADYFRDRHHLSDQEFEAQAGWIDERKFVVRVRFKRLSIGSQFGQNPNYLTIEHLLDIENARQLQGHQIPKNWFVYWLLGDPQKVTKAFQGDRGGVLPTTLMLAFNEWVGNRKRRWPDGYPLPGQKGDVSRIVLAR